jgi:hypothetical protein
VTWGSSTQSTTERIEFASGGEGSYTHTSNGVEDKHERVSLTKDQLHELLELFRTQHACELAHDPTYTPAPDEGQTTLELALPDQHCKIVLWDTEWLRGPARDITETMRSMRPVRLK